MKLIKRVSQSVTCVFITPESSGAEMASVMGFLMYSWVLLPFLTAEEVPAPCALPFIYNRMVYSSCTGDGSENKKLWCATTENNDKNPQWKYCALTEYGGNTGGQACVFPFDYNGRTFYSCTNEDEEMGRFWCATTGSYHKHGKWSYCADKRLHANQMGSCVFPFMYNDKCYSSCTTAGSSSGKLWCSLTSNYDIDSKWTYCAPTEPRPCHFPFILKGKSYSKCTKEGAGDGQLWCATTANYDTDGKWKACSHLEYEGSSKGQPCVFPFAYKNRTFYTCTDEDTEDGRFWCATTGSYDKDEKSSYCADTKFCISGQHENNMGPCVFPFIYKGKTYSSCTTAGASTGKLWCSLTSNYDKDPRWTYCEPSELRPCHFPFIFKGKSYSACTKEGAGDGQLWCATTADYDRDSEWRACALEEYEGNSHGQTCVFPFIYKNRTFYTCSDEDTKSGRFWCATTGNYDKDRKWSYCADTRLNSNPSGPCVFPFIFKGKTYLSCTAEEESCGKPWCSLTGNYDENPKRTYCEASDHSACTFPFVFKNNTYSTCTTEGSRMDWLWCATTTNYDKDRKWKRCYEKEHGGNAHGKPCMFPFVYRNRKFYTCTDERSKPRLFWCATTRNFDKDKRWTYCADTLDVMKCSDLIALLGPYYTVA
uniref:fibronectin-like n=1 Tax=Euleptes europaea TaxID=460621 RepID=UPI002540F8CF|nr:fibronectin-like [Euleptes europaea]